MKYLPLLLSVVLASCAAPTQNTDTAVKTASAAPKATPAATAAAPYKTIIGDVDGIVCSFCVQGIQKRFESIGKADQVVISLEHKKVVVTEKAGQVITDADFRKTIREAGFTVSTIKRSPLPLASIKRRLAQEENLFAHAMPSAQTASPAAQ